MTFHSTAEAIAFFDALDVMKGPSLGTNFTLRSVSVPPMQTSLGANIMVKVAHIHCLHIMENFNG